MGTSNLYTLLMGNIFCGSLYFEIIKPFLPRVSIVQLLSVEISTDERLPFSNGRIGTFCMHKTAACSVVQLFVCPTFSVAVTVAD